MAFSPEMTSTIRSSRVARQEMIDRILKFSKPVKATKKSERIVESIEQQEARILGSDAYHQAFNETVMKPLQPAEDCFNKGYMQEEAFWNDRHNRVAYSYGQNPRMKGLLRSLCDGDGTRALIESRRAEARALSEVAPREELKINVPIPKAKKRAVSKTADKELINKASATQEKSYKESVDNATKEYIENNSGNFKTYIEPKENVVNELNSRYDKELIETDKELKINHCCDKELWTPA